MKILITEAVNASLAPLDGLEIVERDGLWRDRVALLDAVSECEGLVVRNQTQVNSELVAAAPRLRVVGRLGAGLDNLDLQALRARGVEIVHGGGLNARAVAEYVIGACFDLARRLTRSDREVRLGGWKRHVGLELRGQVLGVLGLGATGAETARVAHAVGLKVVGYDPLLEAPQGVERLDLEQVLRQSRFLTLHVPLNDVTRGLIGARQLALLPAGSFVINAARGGVLDEVALLEALDAGRLAGAALDVRPEEPPKAGDPFLGREDVLLTAHLAGLTEQSQTAIAEHVLSGVRRALLG